jgi:FAD/FMN-containing dehydrogenase
MSRIIGIDADAMTVTVEPGIIWEELDKKLKKQSLTLKLYPSSYPGSTAGGWLAHGGSGIGSYEAGEFRQNVVSAKVVLPDGAIREFTGDEIGLVADVEGITGLISELTIEIMPLEE